MNLKKIAVSLSLLGLASFAGKAFAATSDSMTVSVNVGGALSVDVDFGGSGSYNFGNAGVGTVTVSTRTIAVRNDSTALTADWQIDCSTVTANWTITTGAPGADTFRLSAQLAAAQPGAGAGTWTAFDATTAQQNMTVATFTDGTSDGNNVPALTNRNIWFKMETPSSSSSANNQTVTVTVTAAAPSTF